MAATGGLPAHVTQRGIEWRTQIVRALAQTRGRHGHGYNACAPRTFARHPVGARDHALRVLLGAMHLWQELSSEDHNLLCELPEPHGPLFVWLDQQHHEHGNLPWASLREGLREHPGEVLALKVMAASFARLTDAQGNTQIDTHSPEQIAQEARQELRGILDRMLIEQIKTQETEAIQSAQQDPSALERYRVLQARRLSLESGLKV